MNRSSSDGNTSTDETLDALIAPLIGGLNGRSPFVAYLRRKTAAWLAAGATRDEITACLVAEHAFWAAVLKHELAKYDAMRNEDAAVGRGYAFVHYEFDDLFRYFDDPVAYFNLSIAAAPLPAAIDELSLRFRAALFEKRRIPWSLLPLSPLTFIYGIYRYLFESLFLILRRVLFGVRIPRTFPGALFHPLSGEKKQLLFWQLTGGIWLFFNSLILITLANTVLDQGYIPENAVYLFLQWALFLPISLRGVVQFGRFCVSWFQAHRIGVARIKTLRQMVRHFPTVFKNMDDDRAFTWRYMIDEMHAQCLIDDRAHRLLGAGDAACLEELGEHARDRVQRWMNKGFMHRWYDCSWNEMKSISIIVFSFNEKFRYAYDELVGVVDGDGASTRILRQLRASYPDEWRILLQRLTPHLNAGQCAAFAGRDVDFPATIGKEAAALVEEWVNGKVQNIYNTLEGTKKLNTVCRRLLRRDFPDAAPGRIEAMLREKVQIVLLHDYYPRYSADDRQKADIDDYFAKNPGLELHWPHDLLHQSKYGSFTNLLPFIRGEYVLTLDSDHCIDGEEIALLPWLLKRFDEEPSCDALGYRIASFNETYNAVTRYSSLSQNSWWIQDLRVKALVGGGGIFGKFILRTAVLREKEFIQPDSVAEDMLAMTRLLMADTRIRFCEEMEFGQGEDISFAGLQRKYGRYPVGAIESGCTKLYQEVLLSPLVPVHRKFESLFMYSYYPVQLLIALSLIATFLAWITGTVLFSSSLAALFLTAYFLIMIADSLLVWENLYERYGFLKGTGRYLRSFLPLTFFFGAYFYHYSEQVLKALKGFSRFNISEKHYKLSEFSWTGHYLKNRFTFIWGSFTLTVLSLGLVVHPPAADDILLIGPLFLTAVVWGFSTLLFVSRKRTIANGIDILGEALFIYLLAITDLLKTTVKKIRLIVPIKA